MFKGENGADYKERKALTKEACGRKAQHRVHDEKHVNQAKLRLGRLQQLEALQQQASDAQQLPLIPDGAAHVPAPPVLATLDNTAQGEVVTAVSTQQFDADSGSKMSSSAALVAMMSSCDSEEVRTAQQQAMASGAPELYKPRSCYACKRRFTQLHSFYDSLCPSCAVFNWDKRHQTCSMQGSVALLTGGRVKIGFHVALKLLRTGCRLIVTTRFPRDCAARFSAEVDAAQWKDHLDIYGLDLRDMRSLELFCAHVQDHYQRLDVIVHNACQTVRRPAAYYRPLLRVETNEPIYGTIEHQILREGEAFERQYTSGGGTALLLCDAAAQSQQQQKQTQQDALVPRSKEHSVRSGGDAGKAAVCSQLPLLPEDTDGFADQQQSSDAIDSCFPEGVVDVNGQQLDLRERNSWVMKLEDVQTPELAEVFAINAMAPFVMNSKLVPVMNASRPLVAEDGSGQLAMKFIVNVSAMEGKFNRTKSAYHPHTNMAKAALNMMTRTSAADLKRQHIYMTSVDTGWINDENPLLKAKVYADSHNFQTPIDEVDAAARILDPVFSSLNGADPLSGVFLKDYQLTEW